jgi:hypothetical protein
MNDAPTEAMEIQALTQHARCDQHLWIEGGIESVHGSLLRVDPNASVNELHSL